MLCVCVVLLTVAIVLLLNEYRQHRNSVSLMLLVSLHKCGPFRKMPHHSKILKIALVCRVWHFSTRSQVCTSKKPGVPVCTTNNFWCAGVHQLFPLLWLKFVNLHFTLKMRKSLACLFLLPALSSFCLGHSGSPLAMWET